MGKNKDHYQSSNALRKYTDEEDNLDLDKKYSKQNYNYQNH